MGRDDPFPLTDIQQAYLLGRGDDFEMSGVATHAYFEVAGRDLDVEQLTDSWNAVVGRNAMLRATFGPGEVQRILPEVPRYRIATADLRDHDPVDAELCLAVVRDEMSQQVMPVDRWPLFDLRVTLLPDGATRLHISIDNLIADGASIRLILKEWVQRYREPDVDLPEQEFTFRDYVLAVRELEDTPKYRTARDYWLERLDTLPSGPSLPLAVAPESVERPGFTMLSSVTDEAVWKRLCARAAAARTSVSTVLLAAYAEVLATWSKTRHFTVTMTVFNKLPLHDQVDELIGDFSSIALLEVDLRRPASFRERVRTLQAQLWRDLDHSAFGGVRVLREWARRQQGDSGSRMPVVFTSTLGAITDGVGFEGFGELVTAASQTPQVWLDSMVVQRPDGVALLWNFVAELFPAKLPAQMFTAYTDLLTRLVEDDEAWEETHRDLRPAEHRREHEAANDTGRAVPDLAPLHELFRRSAAATPDAPAVIAADRTLTYRELAGHADAVTTELVRQGLDTGDLVAVLMDRGWQQSAAVLGILQAGCAYLPISTQVPVARRELLLADGKVRATATRAADTGLLTASTSAMIVVDRLAPLTAAPPRPAVGLGDLACVLYTSGTTGTPKGVMSEHGGIANTVLDVNRVVGLAPADRLMAVSELNFDMSMYDLFGAFAVGAALVVPDPERGPDPAHWAELADRHRVSVWNSVPAIAQLLVEEVERDPGRRLEGLRQFILGGDWIPVALPGRIRATCASDTAVTSIGGPTEASICQVYHPVSAVDPAWPSIPYGTPLANQRIHILDEAGQPRPSWVPGQICVAGLGVGRGYWADAERTAERFVHDPVLRERLYLTGDIGRYRPGGIIEFLGREDTQVKIHGHRIELGEIEATLLLHPAVDQAAVTAPTVNGRRTLTAYLAVGPDPAGADVDGLRGFLAQHLPPYMLPNTFVTLPALPLSARGKVDRSRLPVSVSAAPDGGLTRHPRTEVELAIAAEWRSTLDLDEVTMHDSFFDLGGDSLVATRIVMRLRDTLGVALRVREFFAAPTIAELATLVEDRRTSRPAPAVARPDPSARFEPFPLTELQRALVRRDENALTGLTVQGYTEIVVPDLDVERMSAAWNTVVARHESLRAVFGPGEVGRVLSTTPRYEIGCDDLRDGPTAPPRRRPAWVLAGLDVTGDHDLSPAALRHLERVREEMAHEVFTAGQWPLFDLRATLLPDGPARLHVAVDGLAADGTGMRRILRELTDSYLDSEAPPLAAPELGLADYARAAKESEGSPEYARAHGYWSDRVATLPAGPTLPTGPARAPAGPPTGAGPFVVLSRVLAAEVWRRLRDAAGPARVSVATVLITALAEVLAQHGGDRHFTIPLTTSGRLPLHPEVAELVGPFTTMSLLEIDLRDRPTFLECAVRIQARIADDLDHGTVDGTRVLRDWVDGAPGRSAAQLPVAFTSTLNVTVAEGAGFEGMGRLADAAQRTPNVLLDCLALDRGGELVLISTAAGSALLDGAAAELLEAWVGLLTELATDPTDRWQRR